MYVARSALAAAVLNMSIPGMAAAQTEDEMAEIEASLGADQAERERVTKSATTNASSLNPDISAVLDVAASWFSEEETFQTGAHDPQGRGFTLQQLELDISKVVDAYFRLDAFLVVTGGGIEVEEAFATTLGLPGNLQVRAGQFFTRFGRLNPTHPHSWDFADQPFVLGKVFGGDGNRGPGVEVSYLTPLSWYVEIVGSTTTVTSDETGRSFAGGVEEDDMAEPADDHGHGAGAVDVDGFLDLQSTVAVKQFFDLSDDWSLLWGLSYAIGPNQLDGGGRTHIAGTDIYLKYRPVTRASETEIALQSEWLHRWQRTGSGYVRDFGGYAYATYKWSRHWGAGARYEYGSPTRDAGGDVVIDAIDPEWTDDRHRVAAALTYWPTEFSRLRLQPGVDIPTWEDDAVLSVFLAAEYIIGAHGAHKF